MARDEAVRGSKKYLLAHLHLLIEQWSFAEVSDALDGLANAPREVEPVLSSERKSSSKPTATMIVSRLKVNEEKHALLHSLATLYDKKDFLPTIADARHFLSMRGIEAQLPSQRADAFRVVLKVLENYSADRLNSLLQSEAVSGPSSLGPLAEAIRAAGATRSTSDSLDRSQETFSEYLEANRKSSSNAQEEGSPTSEAKRSD